MTQDKPDAVMTLLNPERLAALKEAIEHVSLIDSIDPNKGPSSAIRAEVVNAARTLHALAPLLRELIEKRERAAPDEWFTSHGEDGLCLIDDGKQHGMFSFECEWHEGTFIATAANTVTKIKDVLEDES